MEAYTVINQVKNIIRGYVCMYNLNRPIAPKETEEVIKVLPTTTTKKPWARF